MQKVKTERKWNIAEHVDEAAGSLSSVHPIVAQLLWRRGIKNADEARVFLEPNFERDIHDPFLFSQMRAAVDRIFTALAAGEHITIHGDYDADGVTGSAVLMHTLQELKKVTESTATIDYYIPHREDEGYGLHNETVSVLGARGTNVIITVDCGIACTEQIAQAKTKGIDTIVVDHHEFPKELPDAILIHPRLPGESYPFPFLAAVGVAWKVACALLSTARTKGLAVSSHKEKWLLDLVAIATVTDMVPLVGENRVLEHYGLIVLQKTKRLGFEKLFEVAGIKRDKITTTTVGFQIGPRINAAGRMEHAEAALQLFMSEDAAEADTLAQKLQAQNIDRQQESKRIFEAARDQVVARLGDRLLWAMGDAWPAGLVGLAAGKLAQEFARPVLVMGRNGDRIVGSGRSVPGFHITEALGEAEEHLATFGGHPQACGFSIMGDENFRAFTECIVAYANEVLVDKELVPTFAIEAEITLEDLSWDFVNQIVQLAPHGEQNPLPRFLSKGLRVTQADVVGGDGRHVRVTFQSEGGKRQKCIAFGYGERIAEFGPGARFDVVYEVGINRWNGSQEVQCKVVELRSTTK